MFADFKDFSLAKAEEKVLEFWKKNKIFEKSLEKNKGKKKFTFYEGPPTANGRPGIHHVLARSFKDIILRYKTMRGFYVPRRSGWDTHGLPVEIEVEKKLGLKSKKEIEEYGIEKFNQKCKESVWQYKEEGEQLTERMGFWLDLKNPYITYEKDYMETLWWIIKQFWARKLLYKGYKVILWCTRCGTGLSSHEVAQGYETVEDKSVYVRFKLKSKQKIGDWYTNDKTYVLAWTTTPWTLPGNVALAVGEKIDYVLLESESGEIFVVAKERIEAVGVRGKIEKTTKGKDLIGLNYEPLFNVSKLKNKNSYKIYAADFVTTTDGTGVVHTAVMYGEDDYKLGAKAGLSQFHTVDEQGKFIKEVSGLSGMYVKDPETDKKIFSILEKNENLLKIEKYSHEYPFCWRCKTPLLYYARDAWFVKTTAVKNELMAANKKINWLPKHIKEGRFGEWLKEVKDWNFSRERYWGTPLPIWICGKCGKEEVIGSLDELSDRMGEANNEYLFMRHGESETQMLGIADSGNQNFHLTDRGRKQVEKTAQVLKKEKIQLIFASDLLRTKETAQITSKILGIKKVNFDKRIREIQVAEFSGRPLKEYHDEFPTYEDKFSKKPERGESLLDLRTRLWDFIKDTEKKYKGKRILIVSHEYPIWMFAQIMRGWTEKEAIQEIGKKEGIFINVADFLKTDLKLNPRDRTGEINLHRPFADEMVFGCKKCSGKMKRVKEIADVWFDSGAMPLAQAHWPFEQNKGLKDLQYPADYISEGVDQTRGWFYTLLAVATLLGFEAPYKNVICLGLINDKFGQKMSKSKGNIVMPATMIEKYGIDAVRWYFYNAAPAGEPRNFDEAEIVKTSRKFHLILWNSFLFYYTYANGKSQIANRESRNILDQWISERLNETIDKTTKHLENYEVREATIVIEELINDLSRWYIRRSRRRLQKPISEKDYTAVSQTLGYVIQEITKLIAPFTPFFAEVIFEGIKNRESGIKNEISVHLERWPELKTREKKSKILEEMAEVRRLAALGLAKRAEAGIKVRQPLAALRIKNKDLGIKNKELIRILADEVNVKEVQFNDKISGEVELDLNITKELKEEGLVREFVRLVQDLRAKAGLSAEDRIMGMMELPESLRKIIDKNEDSFKKEVGAESISYKKSEKFLVEIITKLDGEEIWVGVRKI
ncbi:MAG: class I tRNA ligase family protein [Candidatus Paceibacterota bacterium]|jgi:isoleucyl-tRNA synthetase